MVPGLSGIILLGWGLVATAAVPDRLRRYVDCDGTVVADRSPRPSLRDECYCCRGRRGPTVARTFVESCRVIPPQLFSPRACEPEFRHQRYLIPIHGRPVSVACHHDDLANRILNLGPVPGFTLSWTLPTPAPRTRTSQRGRITSHGSARNAVPNCSPRGGGTGRERAHGHRADREAAPKHDAEIDAEQHVAEKRTADARGGGDCPAKIGGQ